MALNKIGVEPNQGGFLLKADDGNRINWMMEVKEDSKDGVRKLKFRM